MRVHWLARGGLLGAGVAALAMAQTFPLQLEVAENNQVAIVPNQSTLPFVASVGQSQSLQGTATYTGSGKLTVSQGPQINGPTQFNASVVGKLPVVVSPGGTFSFIIVYTPTTTTQTSAIFTLPFTDTEPGVGNEAPTTTAYTMTFALVGSAASFVVSYVKDGNAIQLVNGGALVFDPQPINTTVTLTLDIANNGTAAGTLNSVIVSGKAFQLIGRPVLPVTIPSGQTLPLGIEYSPTAVESDTGQLQITFGDGTSLSVTLQGSGTSPTFVYTLTQNGKNTIVTPPGPINLPDTDVGSTSSIVVRVQNTGNGTTTVNNLSVASAQGAEFQVSGGPVLPKTLNTNDSFAFTLTFAPSQPGAQTGQLLIGTDLFNLTGNGLGSSLQFSYVANGSKLTIGTNGVSAVVFSPVQVTKTAAIPFTVTNTGTLPAVVSNIAIEGANSPYSVSGVPPLPKTVAPGASFSFMVTFSPIAANFVSDTLLINTTAVTLSGSGTAPPPLPAYTISGPAGNVAAQSQTSIVLTLASPFPVAVDGVLTLTTSGNLGSDPAVQFSTGNRTVPFTIPANGTVANFASQGNQILLQTGTVASTILLTPSFMTAGGVDLTPTNPATLQFMVPAEAPVLLGVTVAASSSNSVVLQFTGYSTTRTLTSLNVQFTAATGFNLATSQVTVPVSQAAAVWFQSTASQSFGGQFTVSVPFTFSGTAPTGTALLQTIASVSGTISNSIGASNAVTTPIQ